MKSSANPPPPFVARVGKNDDACGTSAKILDLEQAVCNALFLLGSLSTCQAQELENGHAQIGGDEASGASDTVYNAQKELHRAFHSFHASWRDEYLVRGSANSPTSLGSTTRADAERSATEDKILPCNTTERIFETNIDLESVMWETIGVIELISDRLLQELTKGNSDSSDFARQWINGQCILSMEVARKLHKIVYEHLDEVRRPLGLGKGRAT